MNAPAAVPASDLDTFIGRYVAMWNESDSLLRRGLIEELWAPDCANFTKISEYRGYDALEQRVRVSWEKWGRDGKCLFRPRHTDRHHGAVRFVWEMVNAEDGNVRSVGLEFLLLDGDGRIREDYQFIEPAGGV